MDKLKKKDPKLFAPSDESGKFKKYSTMCDKSPNRRQPVILTKEEKQRIDEEAPGSYEDFVTYGSNKEDPYHYICPAFWDFKRDIPLTIEQAKKLEKHIYKDNGKIQEPTDDKYILQLFSDTKGHHKYSGFLPKEKHSRNLYMPCCFKTTSKKRKEMIDKVEKHEDNVLSNDEEKITKKSSYIYNHEKVPLPKKMYGHLTPSLISFFNYKSSTCFTNQILKVDECLMRQGTIDHVEKDSKHSFLYAISLIFNYKDLNELKQTFHKKIHLDNILRFHNGQLPNIFYDKNYEVSNLETYEKFKLYKKLKDKNEQGLINIINGFENFMEKMLSYSNHIYLWDIITSGILNKEDKHVNLILLENNSDDALMKINVLCPQSDYSNYKFDTKKYKSIIVYKHDEYYEPIVKYSNSEKNYMFDLKEKHFSNVVQFLEKVNIQQECKLSSELHLVNDTFEEIRKKLPKGYILQKQIMNYNGSIIGGLVEYKSRDDKNKIVKNRFYLPCRPSYLSNKYNYIFIEDIEDDDSISQDYNNILLQLNKLKQKNPDILCKPIKKVIDKNKIVGIITETNQFIQCIPIDNLSNDDLEEIENEHHIEIDKKISEEEERTFTYVTHLKLEERFYSLFFEKMKILLNEVEKYSLKRKIIDIISNEKEFDDKFDSLIELLEPIVLDHFEFTVFDDSILEDLIEDIDNYSEITKNHCLIENKGKCLIPLYNLTNKENNSERYLYIFLSNLMRNHLTYNKIFVEPYNTPKIYHYNLSHDEILLFKNDVDDYFNSLEKTNQYKKIYKIPQNKINTMIKEMSKALPSITSQQTNSAPEPSNEDDVDESKDELEDYGVEETKNGELEDYGVGETKNGELEDYGVEETKDEVNNLSIENSKKILNEKPDWLNDEESNNSSDDSNNSSEESNNSSEESNNSSDDSNNSSEESNNSSEESNNSSEEKQESKPSYKQVVSKKVKKYEGFEIDDQCVNVHFFEGDSIWRTIFPMFTTMYAFNTNETHHCNLLLLNILYKDYFKKDSDYPNIRRKLWKAYQSIHDFDSIQKKWSEEKKTQLTNMENIESHILSETYSLSLMDMMIFCDYYKIPAVFFTRSNKTESNKMKNRFIKTERMTNEEDGGKSENKGFYYYIRIKQHSAKKGVIFSILFYKKDIKLNNNIFGIPEEKYREKEKNEKMIEKRLELSNKIRNNKVSLIHYLNVPNYYSFIGISDDYKTINP